MNGPTYGTIPGTPIMFGVDGRLLVLLFQRGVSAYRADKYRPRHAGVKPRVAVWGFILRGPVRR